MSRKGFTPVVLIAVLALVIAVGGVGIGLAWKTDYLDKWLPANIKEMFGRGEKPEEEPEEEPAEESEEAPEEKPKPKPKLPIISGVKISNVTGTSFTVTWKTDVSTTPRVEFGKTTSYGGYWFSTRSRTQHSLTPKGLTMCTTYHYRVISKDVKGNKATSSDSTFTTACLAEDPLKGWKTYTNGDYGFSFRYPSHFSLSAQENVSEGEPWIWIALGPPERMAAAASRWGPLIVGSRSYDADYISLLCGSYSKPVTSLSLSGLGILKGCRCTHTITPGSFGGPPSPCQTGNGKGISINVGSEQHNLYLSISMHFLDAENPNCHFPLASYAENSQLFDLFLSTFQYVK